MSSRKLRGAPSWHMYTMAKCIIDYVLRCLSPSARLLQDYGITRVHTRAAKKMQFPDTIRRSVASSFTSATLTWSCLLLGQFGQIGRFASPFDMKNAPRAGNCAAWHVSQGEKPLPLAKMWPFGSHMRSTRQENEIILSIE
jgi:hypothetical protein